MKIGIIVAMEEEIKHLIEAFENYEMHERAGQKIYDGVIEGEAVAVVQSGIGKVNASIASSLLIGQFDVDMIINTGSAGAVKKGLAIGDLVISTKLAYHDVDNRVFNYQYGQIPQMPAFYEADHEWIKKIEKLAFDYPNTQRGLIVTADSFVASTEQTNRIIKHFPNALVAEMEGAAVAQTCYQYDIPFVVIRAVSDTADDEATVDFDEFVRLAGQRSAALVISLLKKI